MDATTPNDDSLSPIISLVNRRGKIRKTPEPYVLVTRIDDVGRIRNYAAVVVVRESGCGVGVARPVGIHGGPMNCHASQLVNLWKCFFGPDPTPHFETQKR